MYRGRAVIGMLKILGDKLWRIKFNEFKRLIASIGYEIVDEVIQVKEKPKSATLFGKGKLMEIREIIEDKKAEYFIVYNNLNSAQKLNLETILNVTVMDRYELTLEIFSENASDNVSKLQIELAKIEREIPYLKLQTRMRFNRDRPFFKAGGEYAYAPKLAEARRRRKKLLEKITYMRQEKINQIIKRKELGFKVCTIVGYYNAGKTSIFNTLTGLNKRVSDKPFTTLESKYSKLKGSDNILLVDTIGFVLDLDPRIIKSFEVNVDDVRYADVFLIVIDVSDDNSLLKIKFETIYRILKDVGAIHNKRVLIAANKIDLIRDKLDLEEKVIALRNLAKKYFGLDDIPIIKVSAEKREGINILVKKLVEETEKAEPIIEIN